MQPHLEGGGAGDAAVRVARDSAEEVRHGRELRRRVVDLGIYLRLVHGLQDFGVALPEVQHGEDRALIAVCF